MSSEEPVGLDGQYEALDPTDLATRLARLGLTTIAGGAGADPVLKATSTVTVGDGQIEATIFYLVVDV